MSDDRRLRELERRWRETGAVEDEATFLAERVRAGILSARSVELAAYCGHFAAVVAAGDLTASIAEVEDPLRATGTDWSQWGSPFGVSTEHLAWGNRFARFGRHAVVRFCFEVALDWRPALSAPTLAGAVDGAIAVRAWLESPDDAGLWPEVALMGLIGDWDEVVYGGYQIDHGSPREPIDAAIVAASAVTETKLARPACAARALARSGDRASRVLSVVADWAMRGARL